MKEQLDVITAKFEKVMPKSDKGGFWNGLWQFLSLVAILLFCAFYLLFLNPLGWVAIVICTLLYKFIGG